MRAMKLTKKIILDEIKTRPEGEPENWKGDGAPPQLLILSTLPREKKGAKRNQTEILKVGDRALCRIKVRDNGETVASVMKKLGSGPTRFCQRRKICEPDQLA